MLGGDVRNEGALEYEEVDSDLYDLLGRILTKDPVKRITLKEIKHHPWVLYGLPNPRAWIEETDPAYQSKGKRIEVSNEEVNTAVIKLPFMQRMRSNLARIFGFKDKGSSSRSGSPRGGVMHSRTDSSSSSPISWHSSNESLWDGSRRFNTFKSGDEHRSWLSQMGRVGGGEHPLSQSVTTSPVERENMKSSYFDSVPNLVPGLQVPRRPQPPVRAASAVSTSESMKTVRPSNYSYGSPSSRESPSRFGGVSQMTFGRGPSGSSGVYGVFGGAHHHQHQHHHDRLPAEQSLSGHEGLRSRSLDEDRHSGASLALITTPAVGQVENEGLWKEGAAREVQGSSSHEQGRNHQYHHSESLGYQSSIESFQLTKESLLRKRRSDLELVNNHHHDYDSELPPKAEGPMWPASSPSSAAAEKENGITKVKTQETVRRAESREETATDQQGEENKDDDSSDEDYDSDEDGLIFMGMGGKRPSSTS